MSSEQVVLKIQSGPHAGRSFTFSQQDSLLLGRSSKAHLRIDGDQHISRNHCLIEVQPPKCHIVDLDSANGTYVNEERVTDRWLNDGDTIRGGETQIAVHLGNGAAVPQQSTPAELGATCLLTAVSQSEQVAEFLLLCEVGHGSMGVVYKAEHVVTGQIVALKLLSSELCFNEKMMQVFVREAEILQELSHRRIIRCVETGADDGRLYIAMEFVDGIDLDDVLKPLSLKKRTHVVLGLMRQILDGLAYAHGRNLVHRDIKPRNLLVSKDNGRLNARLADFGLAKNFADAGMSQISSEHEIKGTLSYIAPEQIVNCRFAKPTADIFSVGATMYKLISGKTIYNLSDHETPIATILNEGPVPLRERAPDVPRSVSKIVDRALAAEPGDRFQSAEQMRRAIEKLLK
ncbi:MAG TPA: FHA domain-containing protein [Planctomycetes bacterium]|nr:FHA domain-containing protein [Fuerstiella sp.]HIK95607.1 FHA domain-containing protein [Planctomycetota bacterium]